MCHLWRVLFVAVYSSGSTITEQGFCKEKGCSEERERATLAKSQSERETVRSSGMEWRSHGRDNNDLVSQLTRNKILKTQRVQEAMRKVDRGNYCDFSPYLDSPQSIGYGVTISAPHMHAHALEMLKVICSKELKHWMSAQVLPRYIGKNFHTAARKQRT